MVLFYVIACIPVVIGAVMWVMSDKLVWWEWLISVVVSFVIAGGTHLVVLTGMTADTETWSGKINKAVYRPRWVEEYEEMHTRTVGSGKNSSTEIYYTTEHKTHPDRWTAHVNYGKKDNEYAITKGFYTQIRGFWGGASCMQVVPGHRPGFDSGDRNDYVLRQKTDYVYPAICSVSFTNRIKAAPSVYSYPKVSKDAGVFTYPKIDTWTRSKRLLGTAEQISILEWDRMNARLGPTKKVNVILIGFGDGGSDSGQTQEAKWVGGKKNDLVLCFGGPLKKPCWTYVFG